jgi:hypothetical protein
MREQAGILENITDLFAEVFGTLVDDPMAIDPYFARVRLKEAIDHFEKGGLTAAARAQEHDILAFIDRKGDIVNGLMGAESFGYIFDDDHFAFPFTLLQRDCLTIRQMWDGRR